MSTKIHIHSQLEAHVAVHVMNVLNISSAIYAYRLLEVGITVGLVSSSQAFGDCAQT